MYKVTTTATAKATTNVNVLTQYSVKDEDSIEEVHVPTIKPSVVPLHVNMNFKPSALPMSVTNGDDKSCNLNRTVTNEEEEEDNVGSDDECK